MTVSHQRLFPFVAIFLAAGGIAASGEPPFEAARPTRIGDAWSDARNPVRRTFGGKRLDLWSLRPVVRPEPPAVSDAAVVRNPIDRFISARLEQHTESLAPEADRRTLARRLSFDLTGLPPTPEMVERFLSDDRPDAYEQFVNELLASPRYGERNARMWLDVVRYSDSNGFDWDEFRPQAWRFRDYVIRSFNADKPYDRFLIEQLAGDELLAGPPRTAEERDCLIATGYLRLGPHDNAAPLFNEQARSRAELMADLVETTGSAMLGMTLACCRCHDHKYDPLLQADHYRFRAFFEAVTFADDIPLDLAAEQQAIRETNAECDQREQRLRETRERLLASARDELEQKNGDNPPSEPELLTALDPATQKEIEQIDRDLAAVSAARRGFTTGLLMTDQTEDVAPTHLLEQGDYRAEGDVVRAGFLSALDPNPAAFALPANPATRGRRLALARWIASPENPLTARVIVNRIWQMHFGRGLVATPNDFGLGGEEPTHPALLDWLAAEFVRNGWSIKHLHRVIVNSATYRQSSNAEPFIPRSAFPIPHSVDSQNRLLSHMNPRRLTAEQVRDSLLAVSGLLTTKTAGPPVWPDLPEEVLQANPAFLDDNAAHTKGWYPSPKNEQYARSIFLVQKRTVHVPFLETFDLPENATSCGRRDVSTVAPQALSLLNSPLAVEAAQAFAKRVTVDAGDDPRAQVMRAFALAFQRTPTDDELAACVELVESRGLASLCRVLFNVNEFVYVD